MPGSFSPVPLLAEVVLTSTCPAARSYRDLRVWQQALELAAESDALTRRFSRRDAHRLVDQIERAAGSIHANIAEGNGRRSRADYLRHLSIANGSLFELESHLLLAEKRGLLTSSDLTRALTVSAEVGRLLAGLIRRLQQDPAVMPRPRP